MISFRVDWFDLLAVQGTLKSLLQHHDLKASILWHPAFFMTEKAMALHSSTLAWQIPWMEEPGRLQSMGSLSRAQLSDFTFTFHFHALEKEMATHSSIPAWRIPGTETLGVLQVHGVAKNQT